MTGNSSLGDVFLQQFGPAFAQGSRQQVGRQEAAAEEERYARELAAKEEAEAFRQSVAAVKASADEGRAAAKESRTADKYSYDQSIRLPAIEMQENQRTDHRANASVARSKGFGADSAGSKAKVDAQKATEFTSEQFIKNRSRHSDLDVKAKESKLSTEGLDRRVKENKLAAQKEEARLKAESKAAYAAAGVGKMKMSRADIMSDPETLQRKIQQKEAAYLERNGNTGFAAFSKRLQDDAADITHLVETENLIDDKFAELKDIVGKESFGTFIGSIPGVGQMAGWVKPKWYEGAKTKDQVAGWLGKLGTALQQSEPNSIKQQDLHKELLAIGLLDTDAKIAAQASFIKRVLRTQQNSAGSFLRGQGILAVQGRYRKPEPVKEGPAPYVPGAGKFSGELNRPAARGELNRPTASTASASPPAARIKLKGAR